MSTYLLSGVGLPKITRLFENGRKVKECPGNKSALFLVLRHQNITNHAYYTRLIKIMFMSLDTMFLLFFFALYLIINKQAGFSVRSDLRAYHLNPSL